MCVTFTILLWIWLILLAFVGIGALVAIMVALDGELTLFGLMLSWGLFLALILTTAVFQDTGVIDLQYPHAQSCRVENS